MLRPAQGFTLLEVLLVISLSLLLLMQGTASWQEWRDRQQAESYMHGLQHLLQSARIKAMSQQQVVRVCPAQSQQCLESWVQAPPAAFVVEPNSNTLSFWFSYQKTWQGHVLTYNRSRVEFRADGGLNALQNGTFIYCVRNYLWHFTLTVSQAGRTQYSEQQGACPL